MRDRILHSLSRERAHARDVIDGLGQREARRALDDGKVAGPFAPAAQEAEMPSTPRANAPMKSFDEAALALAGITLTFVDLADSVIAVGIDARNGSRRIEALGSDRQSATRALARMVVRS